MKFFADNLKFLRKKAGMSQEQLGEKLALNRGNIASYEKGTAEPRLENVLKIVKLFNIELSDLLEKDLSNSAAIQEELEKMGLPNEQAPIAAEEATAHLKAELIDNRMRLERFISQSDDMQKILEGFRQFHKFKMSKSGDISRDVKNIADDYENLLEVMDALLLSHKELIKFLDDSK
jgi:transcriptional regulator with XRE-family HTH domain